MSCAETNQSLRAVERSGLAEPNARIDELRGVVADQLTATVML
jgi:hypothetical protein